MTERLEIVLHIPDQLISTFEPLTGNEDELELQLIANRMMNTLLMKTKHEVMQHEIVDYGMDKQI